MSLAAWRYIVGVGKQSTFNTGVAGTAFPRWGDGTVINPDLKTENLRQGDNTPSITNVIKTSQGYRGKLVHQHPRAIDFGFMLQAVFGAGSDAKTGAGDPFSHAFTPQSTRNYFTLYAQYQLAVAEALKITDCVFHSMTITGESGKPLKVEYDFFGLTGTDITTTIGTVSYDSLTANPYIFYGGTFSVDGSLSGTTAPYVKKFVLTYKQPLAEEQTEAVTFADGISGVREVTVDYDILWQDTTQFKKAYMNAGTADAALIGTGAIDLTFFPGGDATLTTRTLEIAATTLNYTAAPLPPPSLTTKAFVQSIKAVAVTNPELTVTLKNSQTLAY